VLRRLFGLVFNDFKTRLSTVLSNKYTSLSIHANRLATPDRLYFLSDTSPSPAARCAVAEAINAGAGADYLDPFWLGGTAIHDHASL